MRNRELLRQIQSLQVLIKKTVSATFNDIELQGHWGKYLCILASGFLENAISAIYIEFVSRSSSPHIANFARYYLESIQNPRSTKFTITARNFKKVWGDELETYFKEDESRRNAIDSIMTNRHLIAHGKNTSISVARVKEYLDKSVEVIEFIESQCMGA